MKDNKKILLVVVLLMLFGFGIGYALLSSKLSITGSGIFKKNSWNVYFDNIVVSDGSVSGNVDITSDTVMNFNANFNKPGDYYEFSVDVINDGSLDAKVDSISLGGNEDIKNFVDYTISYVDGMEIAKGDKLSSLKKETIRVKIQYRSDINVSDLNNNDIDTSFSFELKYIQDDGTAVERLSSLVGSLVKDVKDSNNLIFNKVITSGEEGVYLLENTNINFFRGGVINNNVLLDDTCYYAIRTTVDGDLKLLYNGKVNSEGVCSGDNPTIGNSVFNSDVNNINYTESVIRSELLEWYSQNLNKYDNAIVSGYCDDLTMVENNYYNKIKYSQGLIDLNCSNIIDDKVGLLTLDEVFMIGYGRNGTYNSYLYTGTDYYTMSIYSNSSNGGKAIFVNQYSNLDQGKIDVEKGIRPVITIKANSGYLSGDGSKDKPYIVSLKV